MLFSHADFIFFFLPIILIWGMVATRLLSEGLYLLSLIGFSLIFYAWWHVNSIYIFLVSITINYVLGLLMGSHYKKLILIIGLLFNLALISYYKYSGLFFPGVFKSVYLPLAISFFTFQQIAYLVDIYRGTIKAEPNIIKYSFFVSFFPQLVAGPIIHYRDIKQQLETKQYQNPNFLAGSTLFIFGLFKKLVIADSLAPLSDGCFNASSFDCITTWIGAFSFYLQIYFDFSGYTDMARGLGFMFGFNFPDNFNSPYKSKSIIEFWKRWHITLSNFLKDYLYIPLGGNRHGIYRQFINIFITMAIGGLWHGASWTFMVWGALHGVFLIVNHIYRRISKHMHIQISDRISFVLTNLVVLLLWVPFRMQSFDKMLDFYRGMFNFTFDAASLDIIGDAVNKTLYLFGQHHPPTFSYVSVLSVATILSILVIAVIKMRNSYELSTICTESNLIKAQSLIMLCIATTFLAYQMLSSISLKPFIYFQF